MKNYNYIKNAIFLAEEKKSSLQRLFRIFILNVGILSYYKDADGIARNYNRNIGLNCDVSILPR